MTDVTDPSLPGVFADLAPVVDSYGYFGVAALVLVEDFGVPVPGETILIVAAIYAGAGRLDVVLVALVGFVAAVLGDNIAYGLGRVGGRRLALRFGRFVLLTEARLDVAENFFDRHGSKVVVVARFVEGLRQANGWIAGISKMRWSTFLLANSVGAALWVGTWVSLAYVSGSHIDTVYTTISHYLLYAVLAAVAVIALLVARHVVRRRRASDRAGEGSAQDEQ